MTGQVKNLWAMMSQADQSRVVPSPYEGVILPRAKHLRKPYDIGKRVSSERFMWDAEKRHFIGEISETGAIVQQPLYNDAADVGFVMVSQWTGKEMVFLLQNTIRQDDEIQGWYFKSEEGLGCTIFND